MFTNIPDLPPLLKCASMYGIKEKIIFEADLGFLLIP